MPRPRRVSIGLPNSSKVLKFDLESIFKDIFGIPNNPFDLLIDFIPILGEIKALVGGLKPILSAVSNFSSFSQRFIKTEMQSLLPPHIRQLTSVYQTAKRIKTPDDMFRWINRNFIGFELRKYLSINVENFTQNNSWNFSKSWLKGCVYFERKKSSQGTSNKLTKTNEVPSGYIKVRYFDSIKQTERVVYKLTTRELFLQLKGATSPGRFYLDNFAIDRTIWKIGKSGRSGKRGPDKKKRRGGKHRVI